jgi:hypothetical protein
MWQVVLFPGMRSRLHALGLELENLLHIYNTLRQVLPAEMDLYRSRRSVEDEDYFYYPITCFEGNRGVTLMFHVSDASPPVLYVDDFTQRWFPIP